jgi:hypothetical protein
LCDGIVAIVVQPFGVLIFWFRASGWINGGVDFVAKPKKNPQLSLVAG